jgi:hypothetical protein
LPEFFAHPKYRYIPASDHVLSTTGATSLLVSAFALHTTRRDILPESPPDGHSCVGPHPPSGRLAGATFLSRLSRERRHAKVVVVSAHLLLHQVDSLFQPVTCHTFASPRTMANSANGPVFRRRARWSVSTSQCATLLFCARARRPGSPGGRMDRSNRLPNDTSRKKKRDRGHKRIALEEGSSDARSNRPLTSLLASLPRKVTYSRGRGNKIRQRMLITGRANAGRSRGRKTQGSE